MKNLKKIIAPLLIIVILACGFVFDNKSYVSFENSDTLLEITDDIVVDTSDMTAQTLGAVSYPEVTTSELKGLQLNGKMSVDDGVIYYQNTANVSHFIGYNVNAEQKNSLICFDVYFENFDVPAAYMSFALRASSIGSTLSSLVEQNGYTFVIHPNGEMQVYKNYTQLVWRYDAPTYQSGEKYSFKIGAIEQTDGVRLLFIVDGVTVYDYVDSVSPLTSGDYFNISSLVGTGGAGVFAEIMPTKEFVCPTYPTYTMSTLGTFASRSGELKTDIYNNLYFSSGSDTAIYDVRLQNFSFEFKVNFSKFPPTHAGFHVNLRAVGYGRANSASLGGYNILISPTQIHVFKVGHGYLGLVPANFETGVDYDIEFGTVDISSEKTLIFVNVNGETLFSGYDDNNPCQRRGQIVMTCEGDIHCTMTPSTTGIRPLKVKVDKTDANYDKYDFYFNNVFANVDMDYEDISERNLKSILINGLSVVDLNNKYYGKTAEDRAIDIKIKNNVLSVMVSKSIHLLSGVDENFTVSKIKLQKTKGERGLKPYNDLYLKQSYFYYAE